MGSITMDATFFDPKEGMDSSLKRLSKERVGSLKAGPEPGRERHPAAGPWKKELVVCSKRPRRPCDCSISWADTVLQSLRH
jgi:hypothetical protein